MSVPIETEVKYHVQDLNYYCGAACAQMILASVDVGLINQEDLFKEIRTGTTHDVPEWTSGPDGLTQTLNTHSEETPIEIFDSLNSADRDKLERAMVWALHKHKVASIALVKGLKHWVVVYGALVSQLPLSASDTSYTIEGFQVHDPLLQLYPTSGCPIGQHMDNDQCGTNSCPAPASIYVDIPRWHSEYMAQPVQTQDYPEGYLVITIPDFNDMEGSMSGLTNKNASQNTLDSNSGNEAGKDIPGLITEEEAGKRALEGFKERELWLLNPWKTAIGDSEDNLQPEKAFLVENLDSSGTFHYIALIETSSGGTPIAVTVDGMSGAFHESLAVPNPDGRALPLISLTEALEVVRRNGYRVMTIEPGSEKSQERGELVPAGDVVVHPEYPHLVWRPCLESFSPFYPFYVLKHGDQDLYARIDVLDRQGRSRSGDDGIPLFTELHSDVVGA
jgi:hypothetical protein